LIVVNRRDSSPSIRSFPNFQEEIATKIEAIAATTISGEIIRIRKFAFGTVLFAGR